MYWNHRVCKWCGAEGEIYWDIREVYYNNKDEICFVTEEAMGVFSEDLEGIKEVLEMMQGALEKEVLDLDKIVYGKSDTDTLV